MFQESWIPQIKRGGYTNFRLYNLREDPGQTTDLAPVNPELLARLRKRLLEINADIMAEGADWHLPQP